jgi:uncharacterized protein YoxC
VSLALGIVLAVALFSVGLLLALVLALASRLKTLAASLKTFQRDVGPVLDEVNREATKAQQRMEDMSRRASQLSTGAKIRR